jgi:arabinofuranan 3-O-arabinosyltransferase
MSGLADWLTHERQGRSPTLIVLWLAATLAFVGLVVFFALRGNGPDFGPIWRAADAVLAGTPPYADNPGLVYPPSALPLVAPLGVLDRGTAHALFLVADAALIAVAGLLCLRMLGLRLRSPAAPLLILSLTGFAPVVSILHQGNVNGVILAGGVAFLLAAARGHWRLAGWLLGLALALKPALAPILLLPLLYRQWGALARALAVPVVLLGFALLLSPHAADFFDARAGFYANPTNAAALAEGNVAIKGAARTLGLPGGLALVLRVLALGTCAYVVWMLFRQRAADPVARLVDIFGVVLTGVFLAYTLSTNQYPIYLFPVVVAALVGRSAMRWWGLLGGLLLFGSPDVFVWRELWRGGSLVENVETMRVTLGLLVVLAAYVAAVAPGSRERALLAKALAPLRRQPAPASTLRGGR